MKLTGVHAQKSRHRPNGGGCRSLKLQQCGGEQVGQRGLDSGAVIGGVHTDQHKADVAIAGEAALHRLDRHDDGVVLVAAEAGLACLSIPEEYGGQGGTFLQAILAIEELTKVDPSAAVIIDDVLSAFSFSTFCCALRNDSSSAASFGAYFCRNFSTATSRASLAVCEMRMRKSDSLSSALENIFSSAHFQTVYRCER